MGIGLPLEEPRHRNHSKNRNYKRKEYCHSTKRHAAAHSFGQEEHRQCSGAKKRKMVLSQVCDLMGRNCFHLPRSQAGQQEIGQDDHPQAREQSDSRSICDPEPGFPAKNIAESNTAFVRNPHDDLSKFAGFQRLGGQQKSNEQRRGGYETDDRDQHDP